MIKSKKGLYLHIPFCVKKCNYCDFLSAPAAEEDRKAYAACLKKEILAYRSAEYEADTVFFGGGTPSLLSANSIKELMQTLHTAFIIEETAEITMECNPETVDKEKLCAMRKAGINRISFGLQSAVDRELALLGRIHNYERFLRAYYDAREAGFENISIDLMSAIPEQTESSWEETLKKVIDLKPEHISAYSLIIEEGTVFYDRQKELMLPDEDTERQMYHRTKELLQNAGYARYEISNYARPGFESRHNLKYWSGAEYIGMGQGASSLLGGIRFHNPYDGRRYRESCENLTALRCEEERLTKTAQMEEFCFLGLRRMKGISEEEFRELFGRKLAEVYPGVVEGFVEQGLLAKQGEWIFLTEKGTDVSNRIFAEFLLDE
ncbi:MAG: oxygen-independent coproporphyrinogen III oxidase [Lachnospiraceae bacterium]|nr:oxygen-independent coproporphyrinogen III oxidase [Lachnospiraceae bacterium]